MIYFLLFSIFLSIIFFSLGFAQEKSEKEMIEAVASRFLNSAQSGSGISSELISPESLDKSKEMSLSMALDYDSTGMSNAMMLLPANDIRSMSSAEVWDHMNKIAKTMKRKDINMEWNLINTEIKNDVAFVTYAAKDREPRVMQLKKYDNKWKVVLSFDSIF
jgi:hypothetical protein